MARKKAAEKEPRQPATRRKPVAPRRRTTRVARSSASKSAARPASQAYSEDQIRERAYYIFLERGRGGRLGDALGDWLQAEHELSSAVDAGYA